MSARSFRRAREREIERNAGRERRLTARPKAAIAAGAGLGATVLFAPGAQAAIFPVTSLADDGSAGTLRTAVETANTTDGADTVLFDASLTGTIQLNGTDGAIEITTDSLTIDGPGASAVTVRGDGADRIFHLYGFETPTDEVVIEGLTLTKGDATGGGDGGAVLSANGGLYAADVVVSNAVLTGNHAEDIGGAIASFYGALTVSNSQITANSAGGHGGGIALYNGYPADANDGVLIENSRIEGNVSGDSGGGIHTENAGSGPINVRNTTIAHNTAETYGGGAALGESNVTVAGVTVADNEADGGGGGLSTGRAGSLLIENSTISGNLADADADGSGGGGGVLINNEFDGPHTIRNSTIVENTSNYRGGGVYANLNDDPVNYYYGNYGDPDVLTVSSTIVADNTAPEGTDLGFNDTPEGELQIGFSLIGTPGSAPITETPAGSNIAGTDPQLGPLADNGGPTQTHLPAPTSPALDAGIANGLATDQRGLPRTAELSAVPNRAGSDATDIGAVEVQSASCQGASVPSKTGTDAGETIAGSALADALFGAGGDDTVSGLGAGDCVDGGEGADTLTGDDGNDLVLGAGGKDTADGGEGEDTVKGDAGDDTLKGGGGKDKVIGGDDDDRVSGKGGKDKAKGGAGDDRVKGGGGKDKLRGNAGKDKLKAADGTKDRVNCGGGTDTAKVDEKDRVSRNCETVDVKGG